MSGIVEKVGEITDRQKREIYRLHGAIIKETIQKTKVQIVYHASAKENLSIASLNACIETGPSLRNLFRDILLSSRFRP